MAVMLPDFCSESFSEKVVHLSFALLVNSCKAHHMMRCLRWCCFCVVNMYEIHPIVQLTDNILELQVHGSEVHIYFEDSASFTCMRFSSQPCKC